MAKRLTFPRKYLIFIALCATIFLSVFLAAVVTTRPDRKYKRAAGQLFYDEMTANTLNMHYTLANPAAYGITDYEAVLPYYDSTNYNENVSSLQDLIMFFKELDASKLSKQDAHSLTLLLSYLETSWKLSQYPYHEEPLSPSSGMQSQLPILLAEYTFRSIRDVEDYLDLLAQTGNYFDSLLTFEAEKKEAGLLMAASSLRNVADQCRTILTGEALASNTHFLQITFEERLQQLYDKQLLDKNLMQAYIKENNQLLAEVLLPAYARLADGLTALADASILPEGLAAKPGGAAYYEVLLQSETGSHRNIEKIRVLLTDQLEAEFAQLRTLLQAIDAFYLTDEAYRELDELFPLTSCEDMLKDLRDRMNDLFPAFPNTVNQAPSVHVKEVAECLQDYCAPAFYLTPPLDDSIHNSIYINTSTTISALDLYTTLAHEGYPGHLYQTVYSNRLQLQNDTVPVQQLLWFGGYLEGWALYVEFMAYDCVAQLMQEAGYSDYATLVQIEKHNRATQLCLYSLLDILIHHENADLADTAEILAQFGITNSASVSRIYEYIVEEPSNYPKYYLGYLEILLLKDACREAWAESYSDYAFHKFFLDNGPADFQTLNALVTAGNN